MQRRFFKREARVSAGGGKWRIFNSGAAGGALRRSMQALKWLWVDSGVRRSGLCLGRHQVGGGGGVPNQGGGPFQPAGLLRRGFVLVVRAVCPAASNGEQERVKKG